MRPGMEMLRRSCQEPGRSGGWRTGRRWRTAVLAVAVPVMLAIPRLLMGGVGESPGIGEGIRKESSGTDEKASVDAVERVLIETGNHLQNVRRFHEAEDYYRRALARNPHSKPARLGLGNVLIETGRHREALELLQSLLKEYPDDAALKNNIAWLMATTPDVTIKDGRRALDLAQQALMSAPRDYHVWSTLAEAHFVCGEYEEALEAAEQALSLAIEKRAPTAELNFYRKQVRKCRTAVEVFSLVE